MDVYSPADSADDAEECSKLHYHAEKDRLFEAVAVFAVFVVWVSSAIICVICERLQMADLFGRDTKTIRKHIHNAINEELAGSVVVAKFASTTKHGAIIF